jgi:L-aminopeptidase/D-esterase-like protein
MLLLHYQLTSHIAYKANFGRRRELMIAGVYFGQILAEDNPMSEFTASIKVPDGASMEGSGSVIAIVATDAPLLPGQCKGTAVIVIMIMYLI